MTKQGDWESFNRTILELKRVMRSALSNKSSQSVLLHPKKRHFWTLNWQKEGSNLTAKK